jgi:hypothetical protein
LDFSEGRIAFSQGEKRFPRVKNMLFNVFLCFWTKRAC